MGAMDNKADLTPSPEYQHKPLPDASSFIRLMKIRFIDEKDDPLTLECELITCRIDESPAFSAISYSWGDPARTARLRINGRLMRVTQNCEVALCEAKLSTTGLWSRFTGRETPDHSFYWCDAVCIDQLNKPEKEAQVASMGRIYRRAEKVLASLGAPVEGTDSQFLFRKLQSRSRQLGKIGGHWAPRDEFQVDIARASDREWYRMVKFFLLSMPRCTVIRLCKALECLLGTAYFQRTWIYQELFLGRSVSVCCGSACVPMSTIFGLAQRPLSIIGKGLIDSDLTYLALARPVAAEFKVYLADEDALTLSATTSMIEGSGYDGLVEQVVVLELCSEKEK
ncbi:hypothetical protein INS49_014579 [Diaporthe citri]|uniref:uncharacterized protein n=1 Tax=Diaporthe citri TaxID=83186 RepID=UPI001C801F8D|nr:uncharacterized protein INS49_014579 [Diaporthe citri]KAG6356705.1 hypothetical protein INS49_014579 [Diaporthe citri]